MFRCEVSPYIFTRCLYFDSPCGLTSSKYSTTRKNTRRCFTPNIYWTVSFVMQSTVHNFNLYYLIEAWPGQCYTGNGNNNWKWSRERHEVNQAVEPRCDTQTYLIFSRLLSFLIVSYIRWMKHVDADFFLPCLPYLRSSRFVLTNWDILQDPWAGTQTSVFASRKAWPNRGTHDHSTAGPLRSYTKTSHV